MKLVIGSGQSNAVGARGSEGGDQTLNSRVKVWTGSAWAVARPGVAPFFPTELGKLPCNNIFWNFCKRLQEETGEDVYFVLSGLGSTPISEWKPPSATQWVNLGAAISGALASPQLAGITKADYFLWFQGGSDPENTHYRADFMEMRAAAISSGWITATTPVVFGEIKSDNLAKAATFDLLNDPISYPWMGFASNYGIPILAGYPHPSGPGCVTFGRNRFYNAAMNIPRKNPKIFKPWRPVLLGSPSARITYEEQENYGGSYLIDGLVYAWFKLTLKSIAGGAGGLYIGGLPYEPSLSAPGLGGYSQTAIATDVSGLAVEGQEQILIRTAGDSGLRLYRVTDTGTSGLNRSHVTGKFTMTASLSYFID